MRVESLVWLFLLTGCENLQRLNNSSKDSPVTNATPSSSATSPDLDPPGASTPWYKETGTKLSDNKAFHTDGAYYLERDGSFTFLCSTYSPNPTQIMSYIEKFVFEDAAGDRIEVSHLDSKCSDMLFPKRTFSKDELFKSFHFSADGLTLRADDAINGREAVFKWLPSDPSASQK
jgi:hypothetical protein